MTTIHFFARALQQAPYRKRNMNTRVFKTRLLRQLQKFWLVHWLIFTLNKRTDTWIYNLRDAAASESGQFDNLLW